MNVDPSASQLTFREVHLMAQGRYAHEWNYYAAMMALQANCNRDPNKSKAFSPEQFHPFHEQKKQGNSEVGGYLLAKKEMARRKRLRLT